jgi:hypothetical protein
MKGEKLGFAAFGHLLKLGHADCSQRSRRGRTDFGEVRACHPSILALGRMLVSRDQSAARGALDNRAAQPTPGSRDAHCPPLTGIETGTTPAPNRQASRPNQPTRIEQLRVSRDGGDDDGCCCEVGEDENCSRGVVVG